jgi:hypothetical protein
MCYLEVLSLWFNHNRQQRNIYRNVLYLLFMQLFKEHHRRHDHVRFQWTRTWIEGLPQLKVTNKDVFKVFSFCNTDCDFPVTPRYVLCRLITKHAFIFHVLSNTRSLPCWTYNLIISGNDHKSKHDALRSVKSLRR